MAEPMKPSGEVDTSKRNLLRVGAGLGAVVLS